MAWIATTPRRVGAILLSGLIPGGGHIVLGRRAWGIVWGLSPIVAMALVPVFGPWAAAGVLLTRLGAAVHTAFTATGGDKPDTTGKTVALVALLVIGQLALQTGLGRDVVENQTIIGNEMAPLLLQGDYSVVDKTAFGLRLPFLGKVTSRTPKVGDVVAVEDPDKPDTMALGRVLAIGPTTFELNDGAPVIGGQPVSRRPIEGRCAYDEVDEEKHAIVTRECRRFEEQAGGKTWQTLQPPEGGASTKSVRDVAAGQVLVVQDNRRGEQPWRIVAGDKVRGRVTMIWLSVRPGTGPRWERTGLKLP